MTPRGITVTCRGEVTHQGRTYTKTGGVTHQGSTDTEDVGSHIKVVLGGGSAVDSNGGSSGSWPVTENAEAAPLHRQTLKPRISRDRVPLGWSRTCPQVSLLTSCRDRFGSGTRVILGTRGPMVIDRYLRFPGNSLHPRRGWSLRHEGIVTAGKGFGVFTSGLRP